MHYTKHAANVYTFRVGQHLYAHDNFYYLYYSTLHNDVPKNIRQTM